MADLLIVDDDLDLAEMLEMLLTDCGHRVRSARDGQEGLERIEEQKPDLVLLDVEMPILTGPEMSYRMFLHNVGQEEIPVLLLSGAAELRNVASLVGTPYFLGKPYDFDTLQELIARALVERKSPVPSWSSGSAQPERMRRRR